MEHRCCVLGCLKTSDDGVKLHEFPFDNQSLLPIWIMATNRPDWLPVVKSRICDLHFSIDDYEDGDINNILKPNACPVFNNPNNIMEDSKITTGSDSSDISSTSDKNFSDIDPDDLPDTPNTSDMQNSDDDSTLNISFSDDSNSNDATGLDSSFVSLWSSESELDEVDDIDGNNSIHEPDAVSLTSSIASVENTDEVTNHKCAVALCNENARKQFDTLFFINFPNNNTELCNTWWSLCGRKNKFDPSFKICSIHFDADDFSSTIIRRDGQLYRQTILKNNEIVPTLYLLPQEYAKFIRKRKKSIDNDNKSKIPKKSTENERCIVESCNKSFSKDGKNTLFFKFPLEDKLLLKKWLENIELVDWQPLETDLICSDHFENNYFKQSNNVYDLNKDAIPSIKPKNPFIMKSKEFNNKKYKDSVTKHRNKYGFSQFNLKSLNEDVLVVEEKNTRHDEEDENVLLDSLENKIENEQPKLCDKTPEMTTTLSRVTETNNTNEKRLLNVPSKHSSRTKNILTDIVSDDINIEELQSKYTLNLKKHYLKSTKRDVLRDNEAENENLNNSDIDLEYVYFEGLDNENYEIRPINNTDDALKSKVNDIKMKFKTEENNLKNVSLDISNVTTLVNCVSSKRSTHRKRKSLTDNDNCEETILIPKSKNNGNDCDYIYLDMLNGNDTEEFISFEKKYASKKQNIKIPKLIEKSSTQVTPESIIYNQDLTECYGEMLPAYCDPGCKQMCYYSIPGPQRRVIYKEFQMSHDVTEQNCKITQLVQLRMVKNSNGSFSSWPLYHLVMNEKIVEVCRTFFMNTLGITDHRLDAILKPMNYSWYSDRDTALKSNQPKQVKVISEPTAMTNFIKESSILLDKDLNLFEPESDTEVRLENVPFKEYEKVFLFLKSVPRILSSYQKPENLKRQFFETSICLDYLYKIYSENYIKNNKPPPYTKSQFQKIYNQYMKTFLKII